MNLCSNAFCCELEFCTMTSFILKLVIGTSSCPCSVPWQLCPVGGCSGAAAFSWFRPRRTSTQASQTGILFLLRAVTLPNTFDSDLTRIYFLLWGQTVENEQKRKPSVTLLWRKWPLVPTGQCYSVYVCVRVLRIITGTCERKSSSLWRRGHTVKVNILCCFKFDYSMHHSNILFFFYRLCVAWSFKTLTNSLKSD